MVNLKGCRIFCTACKAEFEMTQQLIHDREVDGVRFRYLKCPECGAAFLSTVIDDEVRKSMQRRIPMIELRALEERKKLEYFEVFRAAVPNVQGGNTYGCH